MPRPKQWELFDKMFYPEAKRVEPTDKPMPIQGARIMYVVIDEANGMGSISLDDQGTTRRRKIA